MALYWRRICTTLCRSRNNYFSKLLVCSSSIPHRFIHNHVYRIHFSTPSLTSSKDFSTKTQANNVEGPVAKDYSSTVAEEEFHKLADDTLHNLQEKLEDYGDDIQIDGFDMDYASGVLTVKLGNLGTYVINKQTPNRQIWLSSPVRGSIVNISCAYLSKDVLMHYHNTCLPSRPYMGQLDLIGIGKMKLGYIDEQKQICWNFWKVN